MVVADDFRPSLRKRLFMVLDGQAELGVGTPPLAVLIALLIVASVTAFILDTVQSIHDAYGPWLVGIEVVTVAVFTIEYALRLWTCTVHPRYHEPIRGRLRYALKPMTIIDLLAILPFFVDLAGAASGVDLRFLWVMRFFRLLRVLKLGRYSTAAKAFATVLEERRDDLLIALGVVAVLLVLSSSVVYFAERDAQPDKFSSIPASMWWAIVTLTTIGYGDVYPITTLGKLFGGVTALLGVGIVALPTAILASGFAEQLRHRREAKLLQLCPHCGRDVHEPKDATRTLEIQAPATPPTQR